MNTIYKMKLHSSPFYAIKEGRKSVELRLFDEKRSCINEGGMVEFTNINTGETLYCRVQKLRRFATFEQLYAYYDKVAIGYGEDEVANPSDMLAYYSAEEVEKYGVVAIELELL